ncbi:VOC family protein [Deinococcus sp. QL22]|uniref:VOC family protein n=1 Tax=Deinococcus sp. QL22 TaxID=2939437 RepID=UPI0020176BF9|nr:VOC family protein [Deinococcus sp. QL22]UQN08101.1 VOC family protein [Deinococcus sp. QL22]
MSSQRLPVALDHCVIHVTDWTRSNAFYVEVMGAELIPMGGGHVYRFGTQQLNVHGPGVHVDQKARIPVLPGGSDLCFRWDGPIEDAVRHLQSCGVALETDVVQRRGGQGEGQSVYFRDPDGSLLEFISYHSGAS